VAKAARAIGYREGDCFAVPLPDGGYALALVARAAPTGGVLFGYFFGPRFPTIPREIQLKGLAAEQAILKARFGDLGIFRGDWPKLGTIPAWRRDLWPMPSFHRRVPLGGEIYRVTYRDENPNSRPLERLMSEGEAGGLPEDSLFGSQAIERVLASLLKPRPVDA
jgi:hypothetical protein